MRGRTVSKRPLVASVCLTVLCLASAGPAAAASVAVDCSAGQTIAAALGSLGLVGANTITVSGNCVENVTVAQRQALTIVAAPGTTLSPAEGHRAVLAIQRSQGVTIDGFSISGGRPGVLVSGSTGITLAHVSVQGATANGLVINDGSRVQASGLAVRNNARSGIAVVDGSALTIDTSDVDSNGRSGIGVNNSRLVVAGGDGTPGTESYIRNNHGSGIAAGGTAYVEADDDVRIQDNGVNGIEAIHTTSLFVYGNGLIAHNGSNGIYLGETSHGEIGTVTIRNNGADPAARFGRDGIHVVENSDFYLDNGATIAGNAGNGVSVDYASVLSSLGGNSIDANGGDGVFIHANGTAHWWVTDTIDGNTGAAITCDVTSLVIGDISGVAPRNIACARVERHAAIPRATAHHPSK